MSKRAIVLSSPGRLTSGGAERYGKNTYRAPGAQKVAETFRENGYETINIEYITSWVLSLENVAALRNIIDNHFRGGTDNVIALSVTVGHHDIFQNRQLHSILKSMKKKHTARLACGGVYRPMTITRGVKVHDTDAEFGYLVDAYFIGRSLNIFPLWLNKDNKVNDHFYMDDGYSKWYKIKDMITIPEPPVLVPDTGDVDGWNKNDVLTIELGIGCKFNCSFCTTPFKKTTTRLQDVDKLTEFMYNAYNKYGVDHFIMADETSNEIDDKYEILLEAVKQLNYKPNISGYARLDMVASKPYQIEQMAEIGIKGLFFGIETFNEKAAKMIRKGGPRQRQFDALREIKTQIPDLFRYGAFITGLTYDSEEDIRAGIEYSLENELLHNYYWNAMIIPVVDEGDTWTSDIAKTPEAFGYNITGTLYDHYKLWKNDWIDYKSALKLNDELDKWSHERSGTSHIGTYSNWEYIKDKALGSIDHPNNITSLDWKSAFDNSINHINKYIQYMKNKHGG